MTDAIRAAVLAIHRPEQTYTVATITIDDLTGEHTETEEALHDDEGRLVYAPDVHDVCSECAPMARVPWPCPTARAVGVRPDDPMTALTCSPPAGPDNGKGTT